MRPSSEDLLNLDIIKSKMKELKIQFNDITNKK